MSKAFKLLAIFTTALAICVPAAADDYPSKPITLVVPYAAGGGADNAARIIAQSISALAGQSVVIENRGGASGSVGASQVARAKADGYTLLYDASSFSINPVLRRLPYDARKDFIAISQAVAVPNILVTAPNSGIDNLPGLLDAARQQPEHFTYASYGPGSLAQMAGELLKKEAGVNMLHVPYNGGAPALVDVMSGQVHIYFANAASSLNYVNTGKLRALAVSSLTRMPELPDVPTVDEAAVKGFDVEEWNGFFAPRGTPEERIRKLESLIQQALQQPETRERLAKLGLSTVGSSSAEFTQFVDSEIQRWTDVVKSNGIVLQD
ncbi:tripartite tricarboxylate transporter substrate binding protein [Corticibacter populi]|uniref:Tripartite tricarboxylate transporter substrate binding protein n=1 Tax=Corticibacter populi TaxID=1550736 RepID=A0A3M6QU61_9BURK|nr:tripartite tricarboxylate transporter substrate binding protein [Corticibacter populi]RMX06503.1 tripartite tricarboxylate transporter substrate binding protein [Corticibacter populi]RZS31937.1 tripartite-type tricarboxylate transporter receptor subunit TctC [Corticibacter populi]